jgi:hypothetical protein
MHAFSTTFTETGTLVLGPGLALPVSVQSKLYEDSIDFGLTWKF